VDATVVQDDLGAEDCELGDQHQEPQSNGFSIIEYGASSVPTRFAWEMNGRNPKNVSRLYGLKPKKTSSFCMRC
jgi:hypothetical protein